MKQVERILKVPRRVGSGSHVPVWFADSGPIGLHIMTHLRYERKRDKFGEETSVRDIT